MATAFRALSNIDHGEGTDAAGNPQGKYFKYGELVVGLSTEVMKELWDAGVLEQVEVHEAELQGAIDARTSQASSSPAPSTESTPAAGSPEGGATSTQEG